MQGIGQGTTLAGRYTLTHALARHDGQEQWLASDNTLDREVTVTCFPSSSEYAEAALDSARRAAGVEDHHLMRVLDVGTQDEVSFVVAEALHGAESIAAILQFDTIPAEEARRLVGETASGLNTAAARGLHHLQLSPHDVMRSRDGSVSVLGVATDASLAGLDDVPSEEASRTDTVALVQVLYAALTGQWPGTEEVPGLLRTKRRADGVLPSPSELVTGVPGDLDTLCRTTLNADEGPRTPGELARQLSPWSSERVHGAGGRPVLPGTDRTSEDTSSGTGGAGLAAGAAAAGAAAGAAGAASASSGDTSSDGEEESLGQWPSFDAEDDTTAGRPAAYDSDDTAAFDVTAAREKARRDRERADPGRSELEPPIPLLQTGTSDPDHRTSRLALAIVALFVVLAVLLGAIGLRSIFQGGSATSAQTTAPAGPTPQASGSAGPSSSAAAPRKTTESGKPVEVKSISSFDPEGTGDEHDELAHLAIDGDKGTIWETHYYGTPDFGGVKSGAGLILDLGSQKQVGSIKISIEGAPTTMDVYVTDQKSIGDQDPFGTVEDGSGEQTVTGKKAVKGRYVIVWITSLSQRAEGRYRDRISEIKVLT